MWLWKVPSPLIKLKSQALGKVHLQIGFKAENLLCFWGPFPTHNTKKLAPSFAELSVFCVFHAASVFGGLLLRNPAGHQKLEMAKKAREFIHQFLCSSPWAALSLRLFYRKHPITSPTCFRWRVAFGGRDATWKLEWQLPVSWAQAIPPHHGYHP